MDLLDQGLSWLADQQRRFMGRTVTYLRGTDSVSLTATRGRSESLEGDDYGIIHRLQTEDWLISPADLVLSDVQVLPKPGDRIRETVGGRTYLYEVLPAGSVPPFERKDDHNLRVHTKLVGIT